MFDFDSFEGRLPWHQSKWDPAALESQFGRSDVLPAWIADMDFKTVPAVQEAVIEAAKNGMYGYTRVGEDVIEAYLAWQRRREPLGGQVRLVPLYSGRCYRHQPVNSGRDRGGGRCAHSGAGLLPLRKFHPHTEAAGHQQSAGPAGWAV